MGNETGKPDFSNVQSDVQSTAPDAPKADFSNVESKVVSTAPDGEQTYTVAAGDNLSKIAKHFYGNADWKRIFDANRDQLSNPDLIKPGQVLKIPAKD